MVTRHDVQAKLNALREEFVRLVHSVDRADASTAAKAASSLHADLRSFIDDLQSAFAKDFISNRMPGFEEDASFLRSLKSDTADAELERLRSVTVNLSKRMRALERLTEEIYPKPPFPWKKLIDRYWRPAAVVVVVVAVATALIVRVATYLDVRRGLIGEYFAGMDLKGKSRTTKVPKIDFVWNENAPLDGVRSDEFSVRWTGFIRIPRADQWEFFTHADDGVRLRVADALLIDDWNRHGAKFYRGEILLEPGYYPFSLEYFDHRKGAQVRLFWKSSGQDRPAIVPARAFVPTKDLLKADIPLYEVVSSSAVVYASVIRPSKGAAKAASAAGKKPKSAR